MTERDEREEIDDEPIPCPNCAQGELTDHGVCVECGRVTP